MGLGVRTCFQGERGIEFQRLRVRRGRLAVAACMVPLLPGTDGTLGESLNHASATSPAITSR